MTLTMNIKVEGFFCAAGHIVSHTHVAACVRHLSGQHLLVMKDGKMQKKKCTYILVQT